MFNWIKNISVFKKIKHGDINMPLFPNHLFLKFINSWLSKPSTFAIYMKYPAYLLQLRIGLQVLFTLHSGDS